MENIKHVRSFSYHEKAECADIIALNGRMVRHHTASREQPIRSSAICELSFELIKVSNDFFLTIRMKGTVFSEVLN